MTHKKANDFIKKWNKDLMIKNYSKLKIKEKTDLIEKRLKEIKSENINIMKSEWKGKPKKKVMPDGSIMKNSDMKKTRRKKLTSSKDDRIPELVRKY